MSLIFTLRSRRVLEMAETVAKDVGRDYIAPIDLLLACTRIDGSLAQSILNDLGILDVALTQHLQTLPKEETKVYVYPLREIKIGMNEASRRAITHSQASATEQGLYYIGTEHLLEGILQTKDATVLKVLANYHILVKELLEQIQAYKTLPKPNQPETEYSKRVRQTLKKTKPQTPSLWNQFITHIQEFLETIK
ncbi:MAG: Clp protease N-terminal domain-containing protein [Chloroflexota bacterium]